MEKTHDTIQIKFKRKPAKQGPDYMFFIPRNYIANGLIDPDKEYWVVCEIIEEKEEKEE